MASVTQENHYKDIGIGLLAAHLAYFLLLLHEQVGSCLCLVECNVEQNEV